MSSPRAAAAPRLRTSSLALILLAFPVACKRSPPTEGAPPGTSAASGAVGAPAAPGPASAATPPTAAAGDAGAARTALDFAAVARELDARCASKREPQSNLEGKEMAAATMECMRRAFTADLDAVLLPLRDADKARFDALMREQALWNKVEDDACWLAEEAAWVDFSAGTRDDGTARGTLLVACKTDAARERDFYARALAAGDATSMNRRFEERDAAGTASIGRVIFMRVEAHKLLARGAPDAAIGFAYPRPLTNPERSELESRARAVEDRVDELAQATCANFPGLEALAGGAARCRVHATRYYFAEFDLAGDFSGGRR